jgi:hypothetical protein
MEQNGDKLEKVSSLGFGNEKPTAKWRPMRC